MIPSLFYLAFPLGALAASSQVLVYDTDSKLASGSAKPQLHSASTGAAHNFISHRLGLDRFRQISSEDVEDTITIINRFAGSVQAPFGTETNIKPGKALIVIDSVPSPESFISIPSSAQFEIDDVDFSPAITADFLGLLRAQVNSLYGDTTPSSVVGSGLAHQINGEFWGKPESIYSRQDITLVHISDLSIAKEANGADSPKFTQAADKIKRSIENIIKFIPQERSYLTIVLMSESIPRKNAHPSSPASTNNHRKSSPDNGEEEHPLAVSVDDTEDEDVSVSPSTSTPVAPLGFIPSCFNSLIACQQGTRNCSSHGECVISSRSVDSKCYTCACKAGVHTNPDGSKKTTIYSGRGCQKEDISFQFWLIAGFSVFMIFLISWAMGMLYTMAGEELPSALNTVVAR